ncbi:MAG: SAM-dependent chlorinase/fluorinase [Sneathiella sp.]|nr:SAM-dependent chlorinase/fluorinase [Sneathiella sp.]
MPSMIALFTDFGVKGPYIGQMSAALRRHGFSGDVINLFADAPVFNVMASSRLLSAYRADFPKGAVFLCIVDPGVGGARLPVVVLSGGHWFVGPDNGIFEHILREDSEAKAWEITWRPKKLSSSFHGRDLFAPIAAKILSGDSDGAMIEIKAESLNRFDWPDDIPEVIYLDHYGNAITGIKARPEINTVTVGKETLSLSNTFSSVGKDMPLAYGNANGLIEIAVNQGRADEFFDLSIGSPINFKSV